MHFNKVELKMSMILKNTRFLHTQTDGSTSSKGMKAYTGSKAKQMSTLINHEVRQHTKQQQQDRLC